jgi:transposase
MSLFLAEVARRHARDFLLLVLDGAGWHRAGDLVIPERMRLYPLPARRPELNPTEQVWDELREKWLSNRMVDCQEPVECQVQKGWAALEQDRSRVASLAGFPWITRASLEPQ